MILIFGSTGYMGSAIVAECERRDVEWVAGRRGGWETAYWQVDRDKPDLVINAAAFIPSPSVDACKNHQDKTILANVVFVSELSSVCLKLNVPLMQLSTGCIFDEQREYDELDLPTRGWDGYCGFYVGTKLLAENLVRRYVPHYILRLRLPFDEVDHPRNYLTKLTKFDKVFEHVNSLTHRGDFAKWALDLWEKRAPYGTYHCVNTGQISAAAMVMNMAQKEIITKMPMIVKSPDTTGARLSTDKLVSAIGPIRSVHEAVAEAISNWRKS